MGIGKVVCEMLDAKLTRYVVLEKDAQKAEQARSAGRPVFQGDATDADVGAIWRATLDCCCCDRGCASVYGGGRRSEAEERSLTYLGRAADAQHRRRLARLPNVQAVVPTIQSDSKLLSLPFGGAVLRGLGFRADDVDMLIEENRRTALGFFDEGVSTPAKPKKAPEKEPVPVEETVAEEEPEEEEEPVQDEPSPNGRSGVEETVVRKSPRTRRLWRRRSSVVVEEWRRSPGPRGAAGGARRS